MDTQKFLNRISGRKLAVVGFESYGFESVVIALLRSLPNFIMIDNMSYNEVNSFIDSESFKRHLKLKNILNTDTVTLVVDLNSIHSDKPTALSKAMSTKELIHKLRQKVFHNDYNIYTGSNVPEINVICLTKTYKNNINNTLTQKIQVENSLLYLCDICTIFTENGIHIIKDRDGQAEILNFNPAFMKRNMALKGLLK